MTNSADPDQLASLEANWSGPTLFAKAVQIWVQQDQGSCTVFLPPDKVGIKTMYFLFPHENICCRGSFEVPWQGTSIE